MTRLPDKPGTQAADELIVLQKEGASARASGKGFVDNPFLLPENMPAATGETVRRWEEKYDAWQLGWTLEDARRRNMVDAGLVDDATPAEHPAVSKH